MKLIVSLCVSVSASAAFVACSEEPVAPESIQEPVAESERDECVEGAFRAAKLLGKALKTRLVVAMAQGAEPAARVCADEAQAIHRRIAEQTGARVGRASTKLRNPSNAPPDWVATYLREHDTVGSPRRTREGEHGRAIIPLEAAGLCLNCHGESISPEVRAVLDERYPDDQATGYRAGELRGVIWAEKPCALTSSH